MSLDAYAAPVDYSVSGVSLNTEQDISPLVEDSLPGPKDFKMVDADHGDGFTNVVGNLALGVGKEIVDHPIKLAANAGAGFGLGYLTKLGLDSQVWRRPTIGLLAVAGGVAAIDLISAAPGWMRSISIAGNTQGRSLEEVQAAEKHLQSLGGGALELGVAGFTGSLVFKPGIASATEAMIGKTRAAIFGGGEKAALAETVPRYPQAFAVDGAGNDISNAVLFGKPPVEIFGGKLDVEPHILRAARRPQAWPVKDGKIVDDGTGAVLTEAVAAAGPDYKLPTPDRLIANAKARGLFGEAEKYVQQVDDWALTFDEVAPHLTQYFDSSGRLVKEKFASLTEYYRYDDKHSLVAVIAKPQLSDEAIAMRVTNAGVFVPLPDGTEGFWRGNLEKGGNWKAGDGEKFNSPYALIPEAFGAYVPKEL